MPMTFYYITGSPPCQAVALCLEALELQPERKVVDLSSKEQLKPEYVKINPQHTVPTFVDEDGFAVWDSHAINAYLVSKYGKDDSLYPKELQKRAMVDQRLHFDSGVLSPRMSAIAYPLIYLKCKTIEEDKRKKVYEAYDFLEKFLEGHDFLVGDHYTLADVSCITTMAPLVEALRIPVDGHPLVKAWMQRCRDQMPGYSRVQDIAMDKFRQALTIAGYEG